jgi:hypothetical protein
MKTKNPRIIFSVTPDQNKLITDMARLTGTSKSGLFGELVDMLCPTWERMQVLLEAAERAKKGKGMDTLTQDLNHAQSAIEGVLGLLTGDSRVAEFDLVDFNVPTVDRRAPRQRGAASRGPACGDTEAQRAAPVTPLSNRGVINNTVKENQRLSAASTTTSGKRKKAVSDV